MSTSNLDCTKCGACCWVKHWSHGYTPLTDFDLTNVPGTLVVERQYGRVKLRVLQDKPRHGGFACIALAGRIGQRVSCSIYEQRPQFCREFKPGSPACLKARRRAGVS